MMWRWRRVLPTPHNITLFKGASHSTLSRGFVDYALHAKEAQDLREWCKPTVLPEEHFFGSLNHNPHLRVPGSYTGKVNNSHEFQFQVKPYIGRYKTWMFKKNAKCPGGRVVRDICILSTKELALLRGQPQMFANKFHAGYSSLALRCLAEELHNRTREQATGRLGFNTSYYEQLPFLKDTLRS